MAGPDNPRCVTSARSRKRGADRASPQRASASKATPESGASASISAGASASGTRAGWGATTGTPNCSATLYPSGVAPSCGTASPPVAMTSDWHRQAPRSVSTRNLAAGAASAATGSVAQALDAADGAGVQDPDARVLAFPPQQADDVL